MPKKMKLKLDNLKIQSFVTQLDHEASRIKGGDFTDVTCNPWSCPDGCETNNTACIIGSCVQCSIEACMSEFSPCDTIEGFTCNWSCGMTCHC